MKRPRLSRTELNEHLYFLRNWNSPQDVLDRVDQVHSAIYFTQSGLQPLLDAWIGATFAKAISKDRLRTVNDIWPDVEICDSKNPSEVMRCECVEAIDPERRRGDEYSLPDHARDIDDAESWRNSYEKLPGIVSEVCRQKAAKRYSEKLELIVHINVSTGVLGTSEHWENMSHYTAPAKDAFRSVWVLWHDRAQKFWHNGEGVPTSSI
jgi:hypothetical protein